MKTRTRVPRGTPIKDRILYWVDIDDNGCWLWQGKNIRDGYAQIGFWENGKGVTKLAHRVSYEAFLAEIPEGLDLDHLCRVRHCVNPDHLEPVTRRENVRRSPIAIGVTHRAKTHCPQGHPYDDANTYTYKKRPWRGCRTCRRQAVRLYRERKAAA